MTVTRAYYFVRSAALGPAPVPTGAGYYSLASARSGVGAGVAADRTDLSDLSALSTWVATQTAAASDGRRYLVLPGGEFTIPYDFQGSASGGTSASPKNAAVTMHKGCSIYGRDVPLNDGTYRNKTYTKIRFTAAGFTAGSTIPTGSGATNPWYCIRQVGGSATDTASPRWRGVTLDASEQISGQPGFHILMTHFVGSPKFDTVTWLGGAGYANVPPGETFQHSVWDVNGTVDWVDCWWDGMDLSGSNVGVQGKLNAAVTYNFQRVRSERAGSSHGMALYQAGSVNVLHAQLLNNGGPTGGASGKLGDGFNSEEAVGPFVLDDCLIDGNSLCGVRVEAGDNVSGTTGVVVDRSDHIIRNSTIQNSGLAIRTENLQNTIPTLTNVVSTCATLTSHFA